MEGISKEVLANIHAYFEENLPRYTVVKIRKKSYHPENSHLYMIAAKKDDGTFTVWERLKHHQNGARSSPPGFSNGG